MYTAVFIAVLSNSERRNAVKYGIFTQMKNYDVIIAGSGAAGLYAAINLNPDLKILVICKKEQLLCNSCLAQGGIAGVYNNPDDNPEFHKHDTFVAGGFKNNPETTDILVNQAHIDIQRIIDLGVDFDKTADGDYHRTLEGGHGKHRIFHHKDSTGREILTTLAKYVSTLSNVTVLENALVCDIKKTSTGFSLNILKDDEFMQANSHFAILATGGIGRIYEFTTNSAIATGDGIAFAHRLGANIKNLHYIQFHPTAFNDKHKRQCFLISEAVRGEGAYLKNCNMQRFMQDYDERLELAPRDVVSHSIIYEARKTGSDKFYIDISHKDSEFIKERFPMIYQNLLKAGYDLTKEPVPIYPCQHYLMGGIEVDTESRTAVENLYACGECSCTGVHGNNRLASNSLLEALVFSRHAANDINSKAADAPKDFEPAEFEDCSGYPTIEKGIRTEVRRIMQSTYFVIPNLEQLENAKNQLGEILNHLRQTKYKIDRDYVEAYSITECAFIILTQACEDLVLNKKEK